MLVVDTWKLISRSAASVLAGAQWSTNWEGAVCAEAECILLGCGHRGALSIANWMVLARSAWSYADIYIENTTIVSVWLANNEGNKL